VPYDVTDHQPEAPSGHRDDLEPVAARGVVRTGRQVRRGHADLRQHRQTMRQDGQLEVERDFVLVAAKGGWLQ
jgi:hypothetical protein